MQQIPQQQQPDDPFAAMGGGVMINGGWVPKSHPAAQTQMGAQAVGTGASAPVGPSAPASPASIQGAYSQALQNLITGPSPQQAGQNVMSSPQVTGYNLARQKQQGKDRAFLAERAAAGGFSGSGGFETGVLGLQQGANTDMARYAGDVAGQAEQGRRQELMSALALAQQMGDSNAARALQQQLGMAGLDLQRNQYQDQLGFNYANLNANMNQNALAQLLGFYGGF